MTKALVKGWQIFLEILFPPICLNCRSNIVNREEKENLLCGACFNGIKIYSNVFRLNPQLHLAAIGSYENSALRELLHYFKYSGFLAAKVPLEKLIIRWLDINRGLASSILDSSSLIIPIPLHKKRFRDRGFNQAEIIGGILSKYLNLPMERNFLERIRDTKSQIKMGSSKEREENVKGSIKIREGRSAPQCQNVILVDDIYTSGATTREAVKALRQVGIENIAVFVIAKT